MKLLSVQEFEDLYNEDPRYAEQYLFNAHTGLSQLDLDGRAIDSQMVPGLLAEKLSGGKYEATTPMYGIGEDIVGRMEGQWNPVVGDSLEEELKWLSSPNNVSRYTDFDSLAKANALKYAQDEYGRTRSTPVSDQLTGNDINRLLP